MEPGRSDPLLRALKDIKTCKGRPRRYASLSIGAPLENLEDSFTGDFERQ